VVEIIGEYKEGLTEEDIQTRIMFAAPSLENTTSMLLAAEKVYVRLPEPYCHWLS
jgi:hypothetical protein